MKKLSGIRLNILFFSILSLLNAGCVPAGNVVGVADSEITAPILVTNKIPMRIGVIIPDEAYTEIVTTRAHGNYTRPTPMSIPFGKILKRKTVEIFGSYFDEIVLVQNQANAQGIDTFITPSIIGSELDDVDTTGFGFFTSSKVDASIKLRIIMSSQEGKTIWAKTIQSPKISGKEIKIIDRNQYQSTAVGGTVSEAVAAALKEAVDDMSISQEVLNYRNNKIESTSLVTQKNSTSSHMRQQTKTFSSDLTQFIPTGKPAGRYDVAVVIGNANYSATGTPNVDFALQDAQVIRQYLIKTFGYNQENIIYIENATLAKMYEVFGTENDYRGKLYKWVKPGQSKIFIYYVGHGAPDQQTGEGYFVPVDANPQYISTSGYKLSTFYENLSKIPAAKKTVVIDACFSGSSPNGQLLKGVSGLTARLKSEPKASVAADLLLTSAGMDQVSSWYPEKGHSLFTYFFLKGLQGDADTNKDGHITMAEMKAWLNEQVPYMARRLTGNEQQPVMMGRDNDELVNLAH